MNNRVVCKTRINKIKHLIIKYKNEKYFSIYDDIANFLFIFDPPDTHTGLWNGLILPKPQCNFMYYGSWLSLISGCYALYKKHYDLSLVPFGVFLTSINY